MFSYPHPVLGNRDDVSGSFLTEITVEADGTDFVFRAAARVDPPWYEDALATGKADLVWRVESPRTYLRLAMVATGGRLIECRLRSCDLDGVVSARGAIVARTRVDLTGGMLHPDYAGQVFSIEPGGVLAVAEEFRFDLPKRDGRSEMRRRALIRIVRDGPPGSPVGIVLDHSVILVRLPGDVSHAYDAAKRELPEAMPAMLGVPALAEAIRCIDDDNLQGHAWVSVLRSRLDDVGCGNSDEPVEQAQRVLGLPVTAALMRLEARASRSDDE